MIPFHPPRTSGRPFRVTCLGAHSDDIEIGCGGAILRLIAERPDAEITWVVLSSGAQRDREARASAARFLRGARRADVLVRSFRNGYFPFVGAEIKDFFEELKRHDPPDIIFTHYRDDRHQDHRVVSDLTWQTWRDHCVLEYEVPKYDGDLGIPNGFVVLEEATCREKIRILLEEFATQRDKHWFTEEAFLALMRIRGFECASPTSFAEAFHVRKARIEWLPAVFGADR